MIHYYMMFSKVEWWETWNQQEVGRDYS